VGSLKLFFPPSTRRIFRSGLVLAKRPAATPGKSESALLDEEFEMYLNSRDIQEKKKREKESEKTLTDSCTAARENDIDVSDRVSVGRHFEECQSELEVGRSSKKGIWSVLGESLETCEKLRE